MDFESGDRRITVNVRDWATLDTLVADRLTRGQGFALATLNLDHLVKLRRDRTFADAYAAQDFVTADGNPVVWMSKIAGRPVELIPGSDAILPIVRQARDAGVSVALLGATEPVLERARMHLTKAVDGLDICAVIAPPMGFDPLSEAAKEALLQVAGSGARLCLLALGAPKQEILAARGRRLAPSVGFVSIGAGLDFFAGSQTRAPDWVRRAQIEWLWRMLSNPRRLFARYALCAAILPGQMVRALRLRWREGGNRLD